MGLSLRVEGDTGSDHAAKIRDPTWWYGFAPVVAPGPKARHTDEVILATLPEGSPNVRALPFTIEHFTRLPR